MKNIYLFSILAMFFLASCADEDPEIYPVGGVTDTTEDFETLLLNSRTTNFVLQKLQTGQSATLGAEAAMAAAPKGSTTSFTYEIVEASSTVTNGDGINIGLSGEIAAGETTTTLPITVDLDAFELGVEQSLTLKLVSSDLSSTDQNEVTYKFTIVCPSTLAGDYTAVAVSQSTDGCCPDESTTMGDVTITGGDGAYSILDHTIGVYLEWYSIYGVTEAMQTDGSLAIDFNDVCGMLSGTATEPFGTAVSFSGNVDPATGVITYRWENGYADVGNVTLTPK